MKQETKQKVLSRVLVCSALLVLGSPVIGQAIISAPAVHATTAANPVADATTMRSITLTKYQATSNSDHGAAGDGNFDSSVSNAPLQGVEFTLYKVKPIGGASLTDPTVQQEKVDYSKVEVGKGVTDSSGKIVWQLGSPDGSQTPSANITNPGSLGDGIYMVSETNDVGAIDPATGKPVTVVTPTNPFFVQVPQTSRDSSNPGLIYDVNAQPKNVIENNLNPIKTINGKQEDSLVAGNAFEWELTTNIPNGLYETAKTDTKVPILDASGNQVYNADHSLAFFDVATNAPIYFPGGSYFDQSGTAVTAPASASYVVSDTLNKDLNYNSAIMGIVDSSKTFHEFDSSLYVVNYDSASGKFTATLTAAGIQAVGTGSVKLKDGSTYTIAAGDQVSTHINTTVGQDWDGTIPNTFDVTYTTPGAKPDDQTPPPDKTPVYADGGLNLLKEATGDKAPLKGADFMIATSVDNANKNIFLASDGNSYQWTNDGTGGTGALPSGVTFLKTTTDGNGLGAFNGLPLDFKDAGADNVIGTSDDNWSRDYFVVETKAPTGFELLKAPQKVTVTNKTSDPSTIELTVTDDKKTNLPFTGGQGTTAMITFALIAIAGGTAIVVIDKKRKANKKV
jgi:fimbrial isopeptide formation D2 family protein